MGGVRAVPRLYIVVCGLAVCNIFSTLSDKRHDFLGGGIKHKVCVLNLGIIIPLCKSITSNTAHTNTTHKLAKVFSFSLQRLSETLLILSSIYRGRGQLKCDGTRAETIFRLSAKRTSPFKSAGASVQSITGNRGVRHQQ
jgi:hypothetical protein